LLHHVMSEFNAMTKEYEILKTEATTLQEKNNEMYDHIVDQDTRIDQLEQNVQVLEAENNELRRSRIIDASTKQ
uniref:HOOK domain-containing protein n=1 Tax=Hydatigena taeniaeformis TaxID=6205 RepID=A0A0R3WXF7_HYDTA